MFYNGSQFDDGTERVFVWVINTGLQIRTNVSSAGKRTNLVFNNYIKCNDIKAGYVMYAVIYLVQLKRLGVHCVCWRGRGGGRTRRRFKIGLDV